jgi:NAD+ synthase (glutamine-hydrolysing)
LLDGLILSLHDYLKKNNISKVFLGLSGGIDSALVLYIASKAIDVKNIYAIMMPSKYTSKASLEDAEELAKSLGVHYKTKSIDSLFNTLKNSFDNDFKGMPEDIAEENFQARIRGITLMGFANKFKGMVLATSNKSELAVGYSTIYGDMVGGFCVLKDVPKTLVYKLAKHINKKEMIIPNRIITREPTAELKFNQTDQDNLPSYDILDSIINLYIEQKISPKAIVSKGFDSQVVKKVVELIHGNEFKRRQSAPGPKITSKAFSVDRRYPITNRYKPKI